MAINGTGAHGPPEVMRMAICWSVAYPLRTRHVDARMEAGGGEVEHAPMHRWGIQESPHRAAALQWRQRPVGGSGRRAETSLPVTGQGR